MKIGVPNVAKPLSSNPNADSKVGVIVKRAGGEKLATFVDQFEGRVTDRFPSIDSVAMEVTPSEMTSLQEQAKSDPGMTVYQDEWVQLDLAPPELLGSRISRNKTIRAEGLWRKGIDGSGVTVAVIDSGIAPHPDLKDRIKAFKDIRFGKEEPYDDRGHGTHVSGLIVGTGESSDGRIKGVAPGASVIGLKVIDKSGRGKISAILKAIQWCIENKEKHDIGIMNLSLGMPAKVAPKDDPLAQAVEAAFEAGILVVVAAGNTGPEAGTVKTPGYASSALTVGAENDRRTPRDLTDDRIPNFSGRGPTRFEGLVKPDVVAPGKSITSTAIGEEPYKQQSGTSMATPIVAGAAALLMQAHPEASPTDIKESLRETARPLPNGGDSNQQGQGLIDVRAAHSFLTREGL